MAKIREKKESREALFERLKKNAVVSLCDRCLEREPIWLWRCHKDDDPRYGEWVCFDCGRKLIAEETRHEFGLVSPEEVSLASRTKTLLRRVRDAVRAKGKTAPEVKLAVSKVRIAVDGKPEELKRWEAKLA